MRIAAPPRMRRMIPLSDAASTMRIISERNSANVLNSPVLTTLPRYVEALQPCPRSIGCRRSYIDQTDSCRFIRYELPETQGKSRKPFGSDNGVLCFGRVNAHRFLHSTCSFVPGLRHSIEEDSRLFLIQCVCSRSLFVTNALDAAH